MTSVVDVQQLAIDGAEIMDLADDMAEAATQFNGQGYDAFLSAREMFKVSLDKLFNKLRDANTRIDKIHAIVEGK